MSTVRTAVKAALSSTPPLDNEEETKPENPSAPQANLDSDSSVSSLVDESLSTMPQVNEQVLAQINAGAGENVELDSAGEAFDASIHSGTKTATGKWRRKKGAPKSVNSRLAAPAIEAKEPAQDEDAVRRAKAAIVGTASANAIFLLGQALGGEEWAPISISKEGVLKIEEYDERVMMEKALSDWAYATGKTEVSPNMGLLVAFSAYMLPRFRMPKTQSKLQKAKEWIATKYVSWKLRKKGGKDNGTQSDSRDDGKRQNEPRQATR